MKKPQGQEQARAYSNHYNWVVSTGTLYTVLYKGQPIQLRKDHALCEIHKYISTTSTQRGTAERLARKLNAMFNCTDFKAQEVTVKTPH